MASEFEIERGAPERVDGGERVRLAVGVPAALRYLAGHFPGDPIVPGIAQLLPLVQEPAAAVWPDLGAPVAIRRLKFKEALRPGHRLAVELRRQARTVRFEIRRGDTSCTSGVLVYADEAA